MLKSLEGQNDSAEAYRYPLAVYCNLADEVQHLVGRKSLAQYTLAVQIRL